MEKSAAALFISQVYNESSVLSQQKYPLFEHMAINSKIKISEEFASFLTV